MEIDIGGSGGHGPPWRQRRSTPPPDWSDLICHMQEAVCFVIELGFAYYRRFWIAGVLILLSSILSVLKYANLVWLVLHLHLYSLPFK
jgi:hypothetical protein